MFSSRCPVAGLRGRKTEGGSSLVEFALIIMVLITLLLAVIEFSHALYVYHFLSNEARQATRWAAVNGDNCTDDGSCNGTAGMNNGPATTAEIQTYVVDHTPMGIDPAKITATVSFPLRQDSPAFCDTASPYFVSKNYPGCTVEVRISYPFVLSIPFIHTRTLTLSSSSEMVIAH